jgi:hypothetical protein
MTLVELMVATGAGSIVLAAVLALFLFSARSFAALGNYVDLDNKSRNALDTMSSDIRQADFLSSYQTNQLIFQTTDPTTSNTLALTYLYDPAATTLTRTLGVRSTVLLTNCTYLNFGIFARNPIGGSWDAYSNGVPSNCKLVQLSWVCQRDILGGRIANTESVQSAKVVMRKP